MTLVAKKGSPSKAKPPALAQPAKGTSVHAAAIASALVHAGVRAGWVTNRPIAPAAAIHASGALGTACAITP